VGKPIDQLKLNDQPLPVAKSDLRDEAWYQFVTEIDELLETGKYGWAETTLTDIQKTVEETHRVTEGQRRAIANIEAGNYRSHGRRYEGFGRRR
jgi:hypothetical protein